VARVLKADSEFLAAYEVRRVMQATGKAARGSLEVIDLLDANVREFTKYNPRADQNRFEIRQRPLC
jgi:hypothetical protein